jgi:hypothetical protein
VIQSGIVVLYFHICQSFSGKLPILLENEIMQRSPYMWTDSSSRMSQPFAMCPVGFVPMPEFFLAAGIAQVTAWQAVYLRAWQMAMAQPRRVTVRAQELPRSWRN